MLQGVLVVQTIEPRVFREDEIHLLTEAAAQVAPVVSEARTLDRFIAPTQERLWSLARNLWWSWDHDSTSLFLDLDPAALVAAQSQSRSRCSPRFLWRELERRAARTGAAQPHQLRLSPAARISAKPIAPGARAMPASCGRVRWPISPPNSACTNRSPIYSGGLGVLAGDHIKSASDLDIPLVGIGLVLRPGIFPAAARQQRLAAGRVPRRPTSTSCPWSPPSAPTANR